MSHQQHHEALPQPGRPRKQLISVACRISSSYSNFAFIVIFAFSTLETGHPFSAASAYF